MKCRVGQAARREIKVLKVRFVLLSLDVFDSLLIADLTWCQYWFLDSACKLSRSGDFVGTS